MAPRLKLSMEADGPSRRRHVQEIVRRLSRLRAVRAALLVAPDGLVIEAAEAEAPTAVEPLAVMAARLGRDLAASAACIGRASFSTAMFSADDGAMFVGIAPLGYVVVLADPRADLDVVRRAVEEAVASLEAACATPDTAASTEASGD